MKTLTVSKDLMENNNNNHSSYLCNSNAKKQAFSLNLKIVMSSKNKNISSSSIKLYTQLD